MRRRPGGGAEERRPTGRTGDEEVAPWRGGIVVLADVSPSRGDAFAVSGLEAGAGTGALREKGGEREAGARALRRCTREGRGGGAARRDNGRGRGRCWAGLSWPLELAGQYRAGLLTPCRAVPAHELG